MRIMCVRMRSGPAHVDEGGCVMTEGRVVAELAVFNEDGSRLAVCSLDGEVKIWSSASRTLATRFSPDGSRGTAVAAASWNRVSL